MVVSHVKLHNFRSHERMAADLSRPVTVITGSNGSGKTSILEAVYCLLQGSSFRSSDQEIIRFGTDFWQADLAMSDGTVRKIRHSSASPKSGPKKEVRLGDKKSARLPLVAKYPVVLFTPADLNLIHRSPGNRRDYFDHLFGRIDSSYRQAISRYRRALAQRNKLLKSEYRTPGDQDIWDALLARYGSEILLKRNFYTNLISDRLPEVYGKIASGNNQSLPNHRPSVQLSYSGKARGEEEYLDALRSNHQRDQLLRTTSLGPHRDDFFFRFNNRLATDIASQGENRTIIVALKFIESDLYFEQSNRAPLILLDDIFSELDQSRQAALMQNFANHQIIITAVDPPKGLASDIQL
ncbi:DNA replication and repair protein RecF [Candidatus Saccharibacteria bacterium]|nr:DNA replication and repair protein RecF [Candidatus Saccharibacteria bacterium]